MTDHPVLYAVGLAVYFVILWTGIAWIISRVGGWSALANPYRTDKSLPDHVKRWQNGQMRFLTGYRHVLNIGSDRVGVYLEVFFLFRIGHPPLFIPWTNIIVEQPKTWFFFRVQTIRLGPNQIPLKLRQSVVEFLLEGKGSAGHLVSDPVWLSR